MTSSFDYSVFLLKQYLLLVTRLGVDRSNHPAAMFLHLFSLPFPPLKSFSFISSFTNFLPNIFLYILEHFFFIILSLLPHINLDPLRTPRLGGFKQREAWRRRRLRRVVCHLSNRRSCWPSSWTSFIFS